MPPCPKCLKYKFVNPMEVWEQDPEGFCLLHSQVEDKNQDGAFMALIEGKKARNDFNFSGAFFPDKVTFDKFSFIQKANFRDATFSKWVSFCEAEFCEGVDFSDAKFIYPIKSDYPVIPISCNFESINFNKECSFSNTYFKCPVSFDDSHFFGGVSFLGAKFEEFFSFKSIQLESWATFRRAEFCGRAEFHTLKKCNKEITFHQAKFLGKIYFEYFYVLDENNKRKPIKMKMTYVYIDKNGFVKFNNSSVALIEFYRTNLRNIQFHNVDWYLYRGRQIIYDEYLLRNNNERNTHQEDYAYVEESYRSIKLNYEEKKDYKRVGDFHYGEMEMHRLGSPWRRRFPLSWYNLYWALNGYGERPLRALIWFGVFLFAFTGLIWSQGLTATGFGQPADFRQSFRFVLEKATFQRPEWAKPVTELGQWIANSIVLVHPKPTGPLLPGPAQPFGPPAVRFSCLS